MELFILLQLATALLISGFLVYLCIPVIVRISEEKNLMDTPNKRKVNKKPVPNLGGVAIFIGISIATLLAMGRLEFIDLRYVLVAIIMIFFIGIKDDILIISPRMKFGVQAVCAIILIVLGDIRFTHLHGIFGIDEMNYASSFLLSLITIVALTNAFNLIDGIDGLASGLGILMALLFGIFFLVWGHLQYAILCAAIVGSLYAFSLYNVFGRTNKVFMGDTGSLIIGLLIAIMAIKFNEFAIGTSAYPYAPALSIAIVFIPLADMARVFVIRMKNKKSPFSADMTHIHHKYLSLGYTHLHASIVIVILNLGVFGILFSLRQFSFYLLFAVLLCFTMLLPQIPKVCAAIYFAVQKFIKK
jgi:UDP-N-acetylmuramyl pentapeptide phosphotransferase/UDP-N-acetylglucosamine-1-phosphate transferase